MTNATPRFLGDLCSLITDGKHGDCRNEEGSGYYFISCKDIKDGRIYYDGAREIVRKDYSETHRRTDLRPGDILLTNSGTIGRLAIAQDDDKTERTTFQKSVAVLKPKRDKITPEFLYYTLMSENNRLINAAGGAAQKNLLLGELRRFSIKVPSISTQVAMTSVLKSYDDLIENSRRRIQLLEQAVRLLYKEWFVHLRFPGHEHVRIFDGVPEGWERVNVPDVIMINPKEPKSKSSDFRYLPMSGLSESEMVVNLGDLGIRTDSTSVRFKNGDTLFARITPCLENGKTAYVNFLEDEEVACGSTEFIVLRGRLVSPFYTYCLARSYDFRENAIKSMIGSSGRQRVQVSCFNDYTVGLPPSVLLEQFDDLASEAFEQIQNLMWMNQRLVQARDLLLPKLMSGAIVV